jgi:RimJ/RimL family protein N-acetyltransferase
MPDVRQPDDIIVVLRGETIALGPLRRDLAPLYQLWMNDLAVTRTLKDSSRPISLEAQCQWLDARLLSREPTFTIYELASWRPIGTTDLYDIDFEHGIASFGLLIGASDLWGRGFGAEATRLMLGYAFDVLGLHNVQLTVHASNPGALRAYERAGFRHIGARRGAIKLGRQRYDAIYMDAVADEFPPTTLHAQLHGPSRDTRSGVDG